MLLGTVGKSCETMSMLDIQGEFVEVYMLSIRCVVRGVEVAACVRHGEIEEVTDASCVPAPSRRSGRSE